MLHLARPALPHIQYRLAHVCDALLTQLFYSLVYIVLCYPDVQILFLPVNFAMSRINDLIMLTLLRVNKIILIKMLITE